MFRRSYLGRVLANAWRRHPGAAEGQRLRLLGSVAVPGIVGALASLFVSKQAVPDTVLVIGLGVLGAVLFNGAVFLWNAALAPRRMERESARRHVEIVESMQAKLDEKFAPFQVAASVNDLRLRLRELGKDAYLGQGDMPSVAWNDRCAKLVAASETFVEEQRNKYAVALHDAITNRRPQAAFEIGKNQSTLQMLTRVDRVLAAIADEIRYD